MECELHRLQLQNEKMPPAAKGTPTFAGPAASGSPMPATEEWCLDGSAEMNIWLQKQVMTKLAESGGVVPASLKHG